MKYTVRTYGDDVLRKKARRVDSVDESIRQLAKDMIETMQAEKGVGLAAQQVGQDLAVAVIDVPYEYDMDEQGVRFNPCVSMPMALVNPEIAEHSKETETADEGCLSFPGIQIPVTRPVEIQIKYMDLQGKSCVLTLKKFFARVVQHELDHLRGVLLVDHMSYIKKLALAGQLKRIKKETHEVLETA